MKLTFLVNHDLAGLLALNYLLPACKRHEVLLFYTRKSAPKNKPLFKPTALESLAAFEAKVLAENTGLPSFSDLKAVELNAINGAGFHLFAASGPDLVISIRHMSILRLSVIDLPKHGVINLHSGLLPGYQGVMSTFRAMINGDANLGTTLHFIKDSSIDSGPIIAQSKTAARYDKSYLWNVLNIYCTGCANVLAAIDSVAKGEVLKSEPQIGDANYFTYPTAREIDDASFSLFEDNEELPEYHN
jgi:methionyl-tRNA formyltransferase